ncbi:MAG: HAD family phosphatase [Clostridia bacterium]|nr:HAD family phosphatase [Clostridia bacterium]
MKIKGAIFDMDGTLIDSLMLWDILWGVFSERYLQGKPYRPEPDLDRAIRTVPLIEAMGFVHDRTGMGESGRELYELATEVFIRFYQTEVQTKAGVIELLDHYLAQGVKMCIATASDPVLVNIALEHCKMEKYFSHRFSCSELGKGKESPDVFLLALKELGTPLEETWVFEDSYVALNTAVSAGFPTVGVYDQYSFNQDVMQKNSTVYIARGESMTKLINL